MHVTNHPPFSAAWWLPGPHLPTLFGKLARRVPPGHERLEWWAFPDGESVAVARIDAQHAEAPTLALLHGLEGGLHSTYARGLFREARRRGWGASMLLFRSCDGRVPDSPRLYHSGETADADFFVRQLVAERPAAPLYLAGVSLGANVLLKWLGEQRGKLPSQLVRAAAVSTPFDLAAGAAHLERGFSRLYRWHFVRKLRRKALAVLAKHPSLPVDRERLLAARTFEEFDDAFTGPVHGFTGAADYYARSSSLSFLERIDRPVLLLSARNDPFLPPEVLEAVREQSRRNPLLQTEFTEKGGHVGFVGGQPWRPFYYMEPRVAQWLEQGR